MNLAPATTIQTEVTPRLCTGIRRAAVATAAVATAVVVAAACAISHGSGSIGGNLTGLSSGQSVVIQNNSTDDLTLNSNGSFSFSKAIEAKGSYSVTVLTQPSGQTCTPTKATGTIDLNQTNVNDVLITCVVGTGATLGGTVTGLKTGNSLVLSINNSLPQTVRAIGSFTFSTVPAAGTSYNVTVTTQPTGQTCTVTNPSGTVPTTGSIANITVNCV